MIRRTTNSFPPAAEQLGLPFDKHPKAATAPVVPLLDPLTVPIAEAVRRTGRCPANHYELYPVAYPHRTASRQLSVIVYRVS